MVKVLNLPNRSNLLGQSLGQGVSKGLGGGLEFLLNQKLQSLAQQQARQQDYTQTYEAAKQYGLSDKQAKALALTPQAERAKVTGPLYLGLLAGGEEGAPDQNFAQQPNQLQSMFANQPQQQEQKLAQLLGQQDIRDTIMQQLGVKNPKSPFGQQMQFNELQKQAQGQQYPAENVERQINKAEGQPKTNKLGEAIARGQELTNPQLKIARDRLAASERKASAQERLAEQKLDAAVRKETQDFYEKTNAAGDAAKEGDVRLNEMEKLIKKGKLPNPSVASFLDAVSKGIKVFGTEVGSGLINLKYLLGADAEQFEKTSNDFVKNAKQHFGARLTDKDLDIFMTTVPTLAQSNEGKQRLIESLRLFNEASVVKQNAMKDIIKENGGKRPFNLDIEVENRVGDRIDKMAEKFKKLQYKDVPRTETAGETAIKALGRNFVGNLI